MSNAPSALRLERDREEMQNLAAAAELALSHVFVLHSCSLRERGYTAQGRLQCVCVRDRSESSGSHEIRFAGAAREFGSIVPVSPSTEPGRGTG